MTSRHAVRQPAARRGPAGVMARAGTALGEVLVTAGALVLLFLVYQLFWTNVLAHRASAQGVDRLTAQWRALGPPPTSSGSGAGNDTSPTAGPATGRGPVDAADDQRVIGTAEAILRIPRLGTSWVQPVLEGTGATELAEGIGHYVGTAAPGAVGNFALAGHRATHGEPWRDLDRMRVGDTVIVETYTSVFTYVIDGPGYLVDPSDVAVLAPVPGRPGVTATERRIVLTTCNPRWASTQRLIVPGVLTSVSARSAP